MVSFAEKDNVDKFALCFSWY